MSKNHYFFNRLVKQLDLYKSPRGIKKIQSLRGDKSTESRKDAKGEGVREKGRDFIRTVFHNSNASRKSFKFSTNHTPEEPDC